jgi:hypothetical protein
MTFGKAFIRIGTSCRRVEVHYHILDKGEIRKHKPYMTLPPDSLPALLISPIFVPKSLKVELEEIAQLYSSGLALNEPDSFLLTFISQILALERLAAQTNSSNRTSTTFTLWANI